VARIIDDTLDADPQAPATARDRVRTLDVDDQVRRTLELIVSELVTNSVVHGGDGSDRKLALRLRCESENVRGEVCDPGAGFDWEQHEPDLSEPGGLGLMLVDTLAERWGIRRNCSTCVWFECVGCAAD
jgi:two-component sensor histidine kinase